MNSRGMKQVQIRFVPLAGALDFDEQQNCNTSSVLHVPDTLKPSSLQQILTEILSVPSTITKYQFSINDKILKTSLSDFLKSNQLSHEEVLTINYHPLSPTPSLQSQVNHPDWIKVIKSVVLFDNFYCLITGSYDSKIRIWPSSLDHVLMELPATHKSSISDLDCIFLPEPSSKLILVSTSQDSIIVYWHISYGKREEGSSSSASIYLSCEKSIVENSFNCPMRVIKLINETTFISGDVSGGLTLWKCSDNSEAISRISHQSDAHSGSCVSAICLNSDSSLIISGGWNNMISIWKSNLAKTIASIKTEAAVQDLKFSPFQSDIFASCHSDDSVCVWDSSKAILLHKLRASLFPWNSSITWKTSNVFAVACYDGNVYCWDLSVTTKAPMWVLRGVLGDSSSIDSKRLLKPKPLSIDWNVESGLLAVCGESFTAKIFNTT